MKKTVAVIYGGEGREHSISLLSAKNAFRSLNKELFDVLRIFISEEGLWYIETENGRIPTFPIYTSEGSGFLKNGEMLRVDLALPILHGDRGEDGTVTGVLECAHIKYVGCGVGAGAVCADKILTKMIADSLSVPSAKWTFAEKSNGVEKAVKEIESKLSYPVFIKPAMLGSSIGISKADDRDGLRRSLKMAFPLSDRVLAESFVCVKAELECAFMQHCGKARFAIGAILSDGKFYDYSEKYSDKSHTNATAHPNIDREIRDRVISLSQKLVSAIGIKGLARIDFFLTDNGEVLFNEINTLPGMTETSLFPRLTEKMGVGRNGFADALISEALL